MATTWPAQEGHLQQHQLVLHHRFRPHFFFLLLSSGGCILGLRNRSSECLVLRRQGRWRNRSVWRFLRRSQLLNTLNRGPSLRNYDLKGRRLAQISGPSNRKSGGWMAGGFLPAGIPEDELQALRNRYSTRSV